MNSPDSTLIFKPEVDIKLYGYRWIIIIIFALYSGMNFFQYLQFTIIANIIHEYYESDAILVEMSGLVFMTIYVLLFIPTGYLAEKYSIKTTSVICSGLTALGNCLKLFATSPDRFYIILISQSICAIAQTFVLMIPTKLAGIWFGAEEVSTACAIGVFGAQIGLALGSILPTVIVTGSDNKHLVGENLNCMFLHNAIASVAIFLIVIFFFRSKPPSPPSESQAELISKTQEQKTTYWLAVKGFARNKDFISVIFSQGLACGMWNTLGILANQTFTYSFPDDGNRLAGFTTSMSVISGGCFATMTFGYLLDKTHKFKSISFYVLATNLATSVLVSVFMLTSNRIGTSIMQPMNGFFGGGVTVIAYEYATEVTYPTPEAFGAAILNATIYIFSIIQVIVLSIIFDNVSPLVFYISTMIILAVATSVALTISPELRRRNANLKR